MSRTLLLSRDGVINRVFSQAVISISDFEILPQAIAGIVKASMAGYNVAVITNQAGVGRGEITMDEVQVMHQELRSLVRGAGGNIQAFYVCPETDDASPMRKPNPGMILQAQEDFGFDPAHTFFVGASESDIQAAQRAGCRPIAVRTSTFVVANEHAGAVPAYDDLEAFVDELTGGTFE